MTSEYTLCILLPCYNYIEGVSRILDLVAVDPRICVVLADDSTDMVYAEEIESLISPLDSARFIYYKGPLMGAVANWNFLLSKVNAKFFTLLHHDEVFSDLSFVDHLDQDLSSISTYVLPVKVFDENNVQRVIGSHTQKVMFYFARKFLPIFNYLGPSSVLIVNQNIRPKFNLDLCWFVDTEWYYRVLTHSANDICFLNNGSFVESYAYIDSITNSKFKSSKNISSFERVFLGNHGYKSTIIHWRIYGFILVKFIFYTVGFLSYSRFFMSKFLSILRNSINVN